MGWSDVGTWEALWEQTDKDANGNAVQGDVFALETTNSYLYTDAKLLVTLGVENLVAVVTEDAVLVASRAHSERVKDVVARLKVDERTEVASHRVNYRPWGSFKSVDRGDRFHVKQIVVKPGGKLSLQKHWHRSEHWIVVKGVAMCKQAGMVRVGVVALDGTKVAASAALDRNRTWGKLSEQEKSLLPRWSPAWASRGHRQGRG